MKRARDYARYSTDMQNDKSVEDQHHDNAEYIREKGYSHEGSSSDRGISGAFILNRPGMVQLIEDAKNGCFDVLVAEHPDRLSRSQADMSRLFQQLQFYNVTIECLSGGLLNALSAGLYGIIGQEQREAIAPKVRRGHAGVLRDGRKPAGRSYGYDPTPGQPGVHCINPDKAKIVRLIFDLYIGGVAPRTIAARLNAMEVPPPRTARAWTASTINGNPKRGTGILCNPHYTGRIVYNKHSYPKNPETGKRVQRLNPESEHKYAVIECLRIIDDATFEKAQAVRRERSSLGPKNSRNKGKIRILSGLLRCSECGGGMSVGGQDKAGTKVRCSKHKESRSCANGRQFYMHQLEHLVIGAITEVLSDTKLVEEYVLHYREEVERISGSSRRDRTKIDRELQKCERERSVLVQKIAEELITDDEAGALLKALREKSAVLRQQLLAADRIQNSAEINVRGIERYRENIADLASILMSDAQALQPEILSAFRELVAGVVVYPRERGEPYTVRIAGHLNAVVTTDARASAVMVAERGGL